MPRRSGSLSDWRTAGGVRIATNGRHGNDGGLMHHAASETQNRRGRGKKAPGGGTAVAIRRCPGILVRLSAASPALHPGSAGLFVLHESPSSLRAPRKVWELPARWFAPSECAGFGPKGPQQRAFRWRIAARPDTQDAETITAKYGVCIVTRRLHRGYGDCFGRCRRRSTLVSQRGTLRRVPALSCRRAAALHRGWQYKQPPGAGNALEIPRPRPSARRSVSQRFRTFIDALMKQFATPPEQLLKSRREDAERCLAGGR